MRQLEFIFSRIRKSENEEVIGAEGIDFPPKPDFKEDPKEDPKEDRQRDLKPASRLLKDPELTAQCVEALRVLRLKPLAEKVVVEWNSRMRTTAGRAFWPCARIELNPQLRELAPEEVPQTLLHELAHLVAYARAGRRRIKAHGVEWQRACADLGIAGESATHSLPLPGRTMKRRWRYTCLACGEGFDRVRKMKRRAACYGCCREHNGGYYHQKFKLCETKIKEGS